MLLLPDFYAFYGFCACSACVGSYLIDSGFKGSTLAWPWVDLDLDFCCLDLLAGGCPAATHFSLLRQRKVSKRKATRLSGSLRFATGNLRAPGKTGVRANSPAAQTARGPDPVFPGARRPSQNGTGGNGCGRACGLLFSSSFPRWGKAGMGASGGRTPAGKKSRKPLAHWCIQAGFQFAEPPSQPFPKVGRSQCKVTNAPSWRNAFLPSCIPDFLPHSPTRSVWACDDLKKRDQGGALFERNAVERVCADPRFFGAAQVARSEAKGPRQPGRLFFAYFLLAKQKKVSCRRATPGQQANAAKTQAKIKTMSGQ